MHHVGMSTAGSAAMAAGNQRSSDRLATADAATADVAGGGGAAISDCQPNSAMVSQQSGLQQVEYLAVTDRLNGRMGSKPHPNI